MYTAVYDLLHGVVDYAGLFPPATLPFPRVVSNFVEYSLCEENWMLGRLIVPLDDVARVPELARKLENAACGSKWRLSCLLTSAEPQQMRGDMRHLLDFNGEYRSAPKTSFVIDAVEIRASTPEEIDAIADALPAHVDAFIELPSVGADSTVLIEHLAGHHADHLKAKIRTGGVLTDLIPSAETVASFIACCATHELGFKATAGLHHPIRAEQALTYDQQPERSVMHGFLNVLLAAAISYKRPGSDLAVDLLMDDDPSNFVPSAAGWLWRDQTITRKQIKHMRSVGMISFGSCSFIEPVEDLRALDIELTPDDAAPKRS